MENSFSRFNQHLAKVSMSIAFMIAASGNAQCLPHWEPVGVPNLNGTVRAMITHDDGSGPALFVAGSFGAAAGTEALNIARLSNGAAQPLGDGLFGTVYALSTFNDGTGVKLYAGGTFAQSGSAPMLHLACWNGSAWTAVGGGTNGVVRALAVHNDGTGPALFVGGDFTSAGGTVVSNIARWNGSTWNNLGGGFTGATTSNTVNTLLSDQNEVTPFIYAAGRITRINGVGVKPVVRWNGTVWTGIGDGDFVGDTNGIISSLAMYDPGTGPTIYRASDSGTKRLSGGLWTTVSSALSANALFVLHDSTPRGTLYIGVTGLNIVNNQIVHWGLLKHDGTTTSGTGLFVNGSCFSLNETSGAHGANLLVGGTFTTAGGVSSLNLATYNQTDGWSAASPITHGGTVSAYVQNAEHSAQYIGTSETTGLYKLSGGTLTPLTFGAPDGRGVFGATHDLEFVDFAGPQDLIAAGFYIGSSTIRPLTAWRNDAMIELPPAYVSAPNTEAVEDLCWSQSGGTRSLLMSGWFRLTTDSLRHGLLRYSSTGITPVVPEPVSAFWGGRIATHMTAQGEEVAVTNSIGGTVTTSPVNILSPAGVWTAVPGTLTYQTARVTFHYSIAWFDDGDGGHFYLGGRFDTLDGRPAQCIARVNGTVLEPLLPGITGQNPLVNDLTVFDDGSGPALYAAGRFESAGGVAVNNIARFKNGIWTAVAGGVTHANAEDGLESPPIYRLRAVSDSSGDWLYATGNFMVADGQSSPKVARYGRCRPCPSDFNHDETVDFFDYLDFVQAFAAGDIAADFNNDSVIDFFDYLDFVQAFSTGC